MRVLLHTPLKPPDHAVPSGDREMARSLRRLLRRLGHRVVVPRESLVAAGIAEPASHLALERRARAQAARLIAQWRALPARHPSRFDLWFTYHCYYRKPDWLGPIVSRALGIPYVIAEASHSPRCAVGPWRIAHRAVERALASADLVLTLNPVDRRGVRSRIASPFRQVDLAPFIDVRPYRTRRRTPVTPGMPLILLSVGMMRPRDKLDSYRVLADALLRLEDRPWHAVIVGDGPARADVEALFAPLARGAASRVAFAGVQAREALPAFYAQADLYLWPAINEAFGMAFLEAQASGLPVVAGRSGGVPAVVADGVTGLLTAPGDAVAFADAVARLLDDGALRASFSAAAVRHAASRHDDAVAARTLASALHALSRRPA